MSAEPRLQVSVIIATHDRPVLLRRLLGQLDVQSLSPERYEVRVVDDGSREDVRAQLADFQPRYALSVERQENAGAAAARQRAIGGARGERLVIVDDDMQVPPGFLAAHLEAGRRDARAVVLGELRPDQGLEAMPLFERFFARMLVRLAEQAAAGAAVVHGADLYTGNVSMPRALFLEAGGFDPAFKMMEDAELGVRLEKAGARFLVSREAYATYGSDKTSTAAWLERSFRDGAFTLRMAHKHPDLPGASPFRFIGEVNPVSRPLLLLSAALPGVGWPLARTALAAARGLDALGLDAASLAGATLVYGLEYFRGVGRELGRPDAVAREYLAFRRAVGTLGRSSDAYRELLAAIRADHAMLHFYRARYDGRVDAPGSLARDAVEKVGFQLLIAYRLMRFFRAEKMPLAARFTSRLIRHLYGSDIHWDAELEPGVVIVHGFGLALSFAARVRTGCILFQNVTLGYGRDAETGAVGGPVLQPNVHVGVGATVVGPITVGEGSKIMAGCTVTRSVPARSIVEAPSPLVRPRARPTPTAEASAAH